MHRVKQIKEIFRGFSLDKAAFSIVHINGDKGKAHFPFVIHPECADKCLQDPPRAEQVHDHNQHGKYKKSQKVPRYRIIEGPVFPTELPVHRARDIRGTE